MTTAKTVTILFTDLVGSTELLQRAGDEQAQRIFKAHHRLLSEAVRSHGGHEVKWLGDGLMVAFDSAAEAVKCAIAMQQSSRRPAAGERLEIRAGLNVGEAFVEEADYFGTSVVIARRLCDSGGAGEIRASDMVVRLLDGRGAEINTNDLGALELKGITNAVPAVEIVYQHDPMALLRKLPFVGRQAEYETLLKKLAEARNGRGSIVLLAGEPGIGKTRLTEEFCDHASSGAMVVRGNCYEGDVAAPFGPWTEVLRSLLEQTPDAELSAGGGLGPGAPDIAVLIPEIRRRIPDLEESPKLDPESERARLFESVAAWLRNAAADTKPLVIFLDDLHWCDRPSLALLEQVARGVADRRIVIVGTYRDVEVDRVHPLAQTLAALRRMEHHERIALKGFSEESVYELLHAIEPSEQAEAAKRGLAQVLFTESEGNPFFLREVLNNLVETGKLAQQDGVWTGTVTSIDDLGIPEGIKEVVGRRLSRMSETCNKVLGRASAMTGGFTWDELRSICEEPEDDLLDALDEALGSQLIAERERNAYAFTHALIRATLYDELSTPRRVQLHRRIAEALESLYAESIDDHLGELAAHYMASTGNAAEKAVEYSIRAGDHAREMFAWEDAAEHYQRALEAMELVGGEWEQERGKALLSLGDCLRMQDQFAECIVHTRQAAELARRLHAPELFADAAIQFERAAYYVEQDLSEERLALLDEALGMLAGKETVQRVQVLCWRVRAAAAAASSRAGSYVAGVFVNAGVKDPAVLEQAREALALAERLHDHEAIDVACDVLHGYGWTPDNLAERLSLAERGLDAARQAGAVGLMGSALSWTTNPLLEGGDIAEFRARVSELAEFSERTGYRSYAGPAAELCLEMATGEIRVAEQHQADFVARFVGSDQVATSVAQLALLRLMQGRFQEMTPAWSAIVQQYPGLPAFAAAFALIHAHGGSVAEARLQIDLVVAGDLSAIPRDFLWKTTLNLLADACAEVAHDSAARALYEVLLPYTRTNATASYILALGSMARVGGRLATMLGRWDEAEQHFEEALASNERQGFHAWTAWTRLNYGDMLLKRSRPGDRERGVALLQEALSFAKESGMGKVERDAERLLGAGKLSTDTERING